MTPEEEAKAKLAEKRAKAQQPVSAETQDLERDSRFAAACAAFVKAQSQFKPIVYDKENPHFRSKYASLKATLAATVPALNANGIALFSRPVMRDDKFVCESYLVHNGVVFVRAEWPINGNAATPQAQGSSLSYARRYTITSILGVSAEDEDDDGNAATQANQPPPNPGF